MGEANEILFKSFSKQREQSGLHREGILRSPARRGPCASPGPFRRCGTDKGLAPRCHCKRPSVRTVDQMEESCPPKAGPQFDPVGCASFTSRVIAAASRSERGHAAGRSPGWGAAAGRQLHGGFNSGCPWSPDSDLEEKQRGRRIWAAGQQYSNLSAVARALISVMHGRHPILTFDSAAITRRSGAAAGWPPRTARRSGNLVGLACRTLVREGWKRCHWVRSGVAMKMIGNHAVPMQLERLGDGT